jgi:hypothetical protein
VLKNPPNFPIIHSNPLAGWINWTWPKGGRLAALRNWHHEEWSFHLSSDVLATAGTGAAPLAERSRRWGGKVPCQLLSTRLPMHSLPSTCPCPCSPLQLLRSPAAAAATSVSDASSPCSGSHRYCPFSRKEGRCLPHATLFVKWRPDRTPWMATFHMPPVRLGKMTPVCRWACYGNHELAKGNQLIIQAFYLGWVLGVRSTM